MPLHDTSCRKISGLISRDFPQNATFLFSKTLNLKMRKMGHFKDFEPLKVGHFEKKHVTNFKTRAESKMNMFDFGSFHGLVLVRFTNR